MHVIAMRLNENLEVERYLRRHSTPSRKELDYPDFPYIFYTLDFALFLEDALPWHWHRNLEVAEVISGSVIVRSSKSSYVVREGELCFINAHALHQIAPEQADKKPVLEMHLFLPELVSGGFDNAFDTRYVRPVLESRDLDLFYFSAQNEQTAALKEHLRAARELCGAKAYGYEFDVRREISAFWKGLFAAALPRLQQNHALTDRSEERMRQMMSYIQKHFTGELTLSDIAASAMVSERECLRCFQNTLGVSPVHYLLNYRVRRAARLLLETDDSVQSISEAVGFKDSSYFGRVFRKTFHNSPSAFRKNHRHIIQQGDPKEDA